jgi:hypothetical protein
VTSNGLLLELAKVEATQFALLEGQLLCRLIAEPQSICLIHQERRLGSVARTVCLPATEIIAISSPILPTTALNPI